MRGSSRIPEIRPTANYVQFAVIAATAALPLVSLPGLASPFSTPKIAFLAACVLAGISVLISRGMAWLQFESVPQKIALAWLGLVSASALWGETVSLTALLIALLPATSFLLMTWLKPRPASLASALVLSGSAVAGIAVVQYLGLDPFHWLGWQAASGGSSRMRVYATLGNPNFVAACLASILPLTLGLNGSRLKNRAVFVLTALLMVFGILVTGSRAPILGAASLLLCALWLFPSVSVRQRALGLSLVVLFAVLAGTLSAGRPISEVVKGRLFIWRVVIGQAPIRTLCLGGGPGSFAVRYPGWETQWAASNLQSREVLRFLGYQDHAHNDWLEVLVEQGVAGLVLLLLVPVGTFWMFRSRTREFDTPARGAVAGMAIFLGVAWVDFPFHRPAESFIFWTLAAIVNLSVSDVLDSDAADPAGGVPDETVVATGRGGVL